MYEYKFTCSACGKRFNELRRVQYRRPHSKKACDDCRRAKISVKSENPVIELGGDEDRGCGTCVWFRAYTDEEGWSTSRWGHCLKGYTSDDGAAVNEDSVLGIVYFLDLCHEFKQDSNNE